MHVYLIYAFQSEVVTSAMFTYKTIAPTVLFGAKRAQYAVNGIFLTNAANLAAESITSE